MEPYYREHDIKRNDIANAGTVASLTKRALKNLGLSGEFVKQVTIGVYEAEILPPDFPPPAITRLKMGLALEWVFPIFKR